MKQIVIHTIQAELVYDIENVTHQLARHRTALSVEDQFVLQTSDTETDRAMIKRSLDRAYSKVLRALSSVLSDETWAYADDDLELTDKNGYYLYINVKDDFREAKTEAAAMAFHDFLINTALFDWLLVGKPDEAAAYKVLMEENLSELKGVVMDRTGFYAVDPFPHFKEESGRYR